MLNHLNVRLFTLISLLCLAFATKADTIERYMNIVDNIPKMEMKADSDAQVWVRSARNVVELTCESIAETLTLANKTATENRKPLFCLPSQATLDTSFLNHLIQDTYRNLPTPKDAKDKMNVSEIALLGLMQKYPCQPGVPANHLNHASLSSEGMLHVGALNTQDR